MFTILSDPQSRASRTFRKRFRVAWKFFREVLLPWTREKFPFKPDAAGSLEIPTEFKLLGGLRVLSRSAHFDDLAEDANCGDGVKLYGPSFTSGAK